MSNPDGSVSTYLGNLNPSERQLLETITDKEINDHMKLSDHSRVGTALAIATEKLGNLEGWNDTPVEVRTTFDLGHLDNVAIQYEEECEENSQNMWLIANTIKKMNNLPKTKPAELVNDRALTLHLLASRAEGMELTYSYFLWALWSVQHFMIDRRFGFVQEFLDVCSNAHYKRLNPLCKEIVPVTPQQVWDDPRCLVKLPKTASKEPGNVPERTKNKKGKKQHKTTDKRKEKEYEAMSQCNRVLEAIDQSNRQMKILIHDAREIGRPTNTKTLNLQLPMSARGHFNFYGVAIPSTIPDKVRQDFDDLEFLSNEVESLRHVVLSGVSHNLESYPGLALLFPSRCFLSASLPLTHSC